MEPPSRGRLKRPLDRQASGVWQEGPSGEHRAAALRRESPAETDGELCPLLRPFALRHYPTVLRGTACGASDARSAPLHSNEPRRAAARGTSGVVVLRALPVRLRRPGGLAVPACRGAGPPGRGEAGRGARAREAEGVRAAHGAAAAAIVGAAG